MKVHANCDTTCYIQTVALDEQALSKQKRSLSTPPVLHAPHRSVSMYSTAKAIAKDAAYKAAATAEGKLSTWEQQEASSSKKKAYQLVKKGATLFKSRVSTARENDTATVSDREHEVGAVGTCSDTKSIWPHLVPSGCLLPPVSVLTP
jgi:hypothetical protein